ncbi:amyloid fiber anchoring/assembly protein TapA [Lederbergia citri]|uniref:Amyloid fiber anchoring/assembly protein TapA n=1 Tax=Lederbergia citri TaxID=2833580 RepID=A0A942YI46_9BACI|nr:amyloid fiber anchoring/assembly protein TapA [Lederbergia citri]MBS4197222.1 amyloid fiber anchoring/assembly protein TapA [Lederbergia citri]
MQRVKKYKRKNRYVNILLRLAAVLYLCVGISATFTGKTNAFFSSSMTLTGTIQAGTWETEDSGNEEKEVWDKSSLKFVSAQYDGNEIFAIIKNIGSDMKENGLYEIYFREKGNPKQGTVTTKILTFKPLKKGEEIKLSFTPDKTGNYMFKAYQPKGHPGTSELWSEAISVNLAKKKAESIDEQVEPEKQDETVSRETKIKEPVREEKSEPPKNEQISQTDVEKEKDLNTSEVQEENIIKKDTPSEEIENTEK